MFRKNIVTGFLLAVVLSTAVSCDLFYDNTISKDDLMSTNVSFDYLIARGFNVRFVGVMTTVQDIMTNAIGHTFFGDISLNFQNIFIVDNKDIITIANNKRVCYNTGEN